MNEKLPCGCIPGEYLCPVAEQLWCMYGIAHNAGNHIEANDYRLQYDLHLLRYEKMIINQYGKEMQFDAVRNLMDDEIVETLLANEIYTSDQMLFDDYCLAHKKTYGEDFELDKPNPVW